MDAIGVGPGRDRCEPIVAPICHGGQTWPRQSVAPRVPVVRVRVMDPNRPDCSRFTADRVGQCVVGRGRIHPQGCLAGVATMPVSRQGPVSPRIRRPQSPPEDGRASRPKKACRAIARQASVQRFLGFAGDQLVRSSRSISSRAIFWVSWRNRIRHWRVKPARKTRQKMASTKNQWTGAPKSSSA